MNQLPELYEPLDELLEHPTVRILRALRRLGWVSSYELNEELRVLYDRHVTNAFTARLGRLYRDGLVQRRKSPAVKGLFGLGGLGSDYEYSITDAGREDLESWLSRAQPERELRGRSEDDRDFLRELAVRDYREERDRCGARRRSA